MRSCKHIGKRPPGVWGTMADAFQWVSAYLPHLFPPNEVVQTCWKEERQGSGGAWGTGVSPRPACTPDTAPARRNRTPLLLQLSLSPQLRHLRGLFPCASAWIGTSLLAPTVNASPLHGDRAVPPPPPPPDCSVSIDPASKPATKPPVPSSL